MLFQPDFFFRDIQSFEVINQFLLKPVFVGLVCSRSDLVMFLESCPDPLADIIETFVLKGFDRIKQIKDQLYPGSYIGFKDAAFGCTEFLN